jgi:ATP-dependent exoDNAse (exonuclease V) alpha subunit
VFFDEAGMADTRRMDALSELVAQRRAKLVLVGDARQPPSIGAGGMFELGPEEVALPTAPHGLRAGDRVAFIAVHRVAGEARVENGTRAEVIAVEPDRSGRAK